MASSIEQICNMALSEIGARSTISSLGDLSKEAQTCALWVNTVRLTLLRVAHWGFARRQVELAKLGELTAVPPTSPFPWQYSYDYPADCVKVRYLLVKPPPSEEGVVITGESLFYNPWLMPSRNNRFLVANDQGLGLPATAGRIILSNIADAIGVYTADVTDTTQWDQGFEDAYIAVLASKLVMPLAGKAGLKGVFEQLASQTVIAARASDGNEARPSTIHTPDWITARGGGLDVQALNGMGVWWQGWDTMPWGE